MTQDNDLLSTNFILKKNIANLEDFHSLLNVVEQKLKETSNLVIVLLETTEEEDHSQTLDPFDVKTVKEEIFFPEEKGIDIDHGNILDNDDDDYKDLDYDFEEESKKNIKIKKEKKVKAKKEKVPNSTPKKRPREKRKEYESGLCTDCGKVYADIRKHRQTKHDKIMRTWQCPHCGLELQSIWNHTFFNHRQECEAKISGITDRYGCRAECGEKFATLKARTKHHMVCLKKHGIIARPKHKPQKKCTYEGCEYAAYKDQNLKNHINRVHLKIALDKDYACENCGEKFNSKDTLKHHNIQHHSGRRDYKCDQCGAAFAHSQLLNKHMDIHSDIRKYVCPYCMKGFKQDSVLYRHKLSCQFNPKKNPT